MTYKNKIKITDFVDFNPKRTIKNGTHAPFIDMAALPVDSRDISEIGEREFKGGGSKFINGDTLFARITPCLENGKTAKVDGLKADDVAHGSTEFIVMAAKEPDYDEDYVYYLARLPEFRLFAQARMEGTSGRQRVSWQSLTDFEFDFPQKEVRQRAGEFLKKIDDKITLNRQTNQTLEQIAQAIFKSWFVDFDPVRAKIAAREAFIQQYPEVTAEAIRAAGTEGDTLAHAGAKACELAAMCVISGKTEEQLNELDADTLQQLKAIAALFPDELVESELGEIPEDWACGTLSDIGSFGDERIDVTKLSLENYISTENMLEGKKGITAATSLPSVKAVPAFNKGQILVSNIRPYFRKIWLAQFEGGRSNDVLGFDANDSESIEYLYNLLFQDAFFNFMMTTSKGAKMPRGDKDAIMGWATPIPDVEMRREYSNAVRSYYEIINSKNKENRFLADLRDTLLPKLLSGEISPGAIESTAKAVA